MFFLFSLLLELPKKVAVNNDPRTCPLTEAISSQSGGVQEHQWLLKKQGQMRNQCLTFMI